MGKKANFGCGNEIKEGYINCDMLELDGVDMVFDLESYSYPFKDGDLSEIYANQVLEHLHDLVKFMEESWRILEPGGIVHVKVPYYTSPWAFSDPTHKRFFTYYTFDYFTEGFAYNFYTPARFEIVKRTLSFPKGFGFLGFIFNRIPKFYQTFLPFIIPAGGLEFILKKS